MNLYSRVRATFKVIAHQVQNSCMRFSQHSNMLLMNHFLLLSMLKTVVLLFFVKNHDLVFSGFFDEWKVEKNSIYLNKTMSFVTILMKALSFWSIKCIFAVYKLWIWYSINLTDSYIYCETQILILTSSSSLISFCLATSASAFTLCYEIFLWVPHFQRNCAISFNYTVQIAIASREKECTLMW